MTRLQVPSEYITARSSSGGSGSFSGAGVGFGIGGRPIRYTHFNHGLAADARSSAGAAPSPLVPVAVSSVTQPPLSVAGAGGGPANLSAERTAASAALPEVRVHRSMLSPSLT